MIVSLNIKSDFAPITKYKSFSIRPVLGTIVELNGEFGCMVSLHPGQSVGALEHWRNKVYTLTLLNYTPYKLD